MKAIQFLKITDHPNYLAFSNGFIYSRKTNKFLKGTPNHKGYLQVYLDRHNHRVAGVVLNAFTPKPFSGAVCRHKDGTRTNNVLSNLEWGTPKQNQEDMIKHGRSTRGTRCPNSKLNANQVIEVRKALQLGLSASQKITIANKYGVSIATIYDIKTRRTWGWLT